MQAIWRVHPADPRRAASLARSLGLHPITAQLLLNRGVTDGPQGARFLNPGLEALDDPFRLPDMERAIARLKRAIRVGEPVMVFGDSDVDGLTAGAILYEALRQHGAMVRARMSNRIADGYGLPHRIVQQLLRSSTKLLILVDCGTNQPDAIRLLASGGIDVIVVDHHVPLGERARPLALINPHCADGTDGVPGLGRGLSSAGLAFKVAHALAGADGPDTLNDALDLAALGTLADCSPMLGDNRILVSEGVARIIHSRRPGLRRLCEATGTLKADPDHIVRRLVPRLNASGRLGDPTAVWRLLLREDTQPLEEWLEAAETAHARTKQLHRRLIAEAQEQVNRLHFRDQFVMVVSRSGWPQGLMGVLASQLSQRYGRPAIAIAMGERHGTGSGRSIPLFNLLEALQACQGLLVRFGGHAQACGLTVDRKHLEPFRALLNQRAREALGREGLLRIRTVDLELPLQAVAPGWVGEVERLAPFGQGNPRPSVVIRRVTLEVRSPRTAVLSDGAGRVAARGVFPGLPQGGRYDVVANPTLVEGDVVLAASDVRSATTTVGSPSAGTAL